MAGAILGVENKLAEAAEMYGEMYAEAFWPAFDDLKRRVGPGGAAVPGDDFRVLFYAFSKRKIEQLLGVIDVEDSLESPDAGSCDRGGWNAFCLRSHRR